MIKEGPDEPYYLGEIEVVDPLGEFLEVRLWGSYKQEDSLHKLTWKPAWVDAKDNAAVYSHRGRASWSPWKMTAIKSEIKTRASFTLTSRGKIPCP